MEWQIFDKMCDKLGKSKRWRVPKYDFKHPAASKPLNYVD